MSENNPAIGVQRGDIKCHWGDIAEGNQIGRSIALVIMVVVVLLNRQRMIRGTE